MDARRHRVSGRNLGQGTRHSRKATTSLPDVASSPLVGSSKTRTRGLATTEHAIVTRRFCPPEMPRCNGVPIRLFAIDASPRDCSVESMWSAMLGYAGPSLLWYTRGQLITLRQPDGDATPIRQRRDATAKPQSTHAKCAANVTVSLTVNTPRRASSCSTNENSSRVENSVEPLTVT